MLPSTGLQRVGHNLATEHHQQNKSASCSVISLNLSEVKEKIQMSETDRPLPVSKNLSKLPKSLILGFSFCNMATTTLASQGFSGG